MTEGHWTSEMDEVLDKITESSSVYKKLHLKMANQKTKVYNRLTIAGIVIGPLVGILTGIDSSLPGLKITAITMSMFSGIIMSVIKFGRYEDFIQLNKQAAGGYATIENNIELQMVLPYESRISAKLYLEIIQDKFDDLFSRSPLLPAHIYEQIKHEDVKENDIHEVVRSTTQREISDKRLVYEMKRMESRL
jgi:hypothetical protein